MTWLEKRSVFFFTGSISAFKCCDVLACCYCGLGSEVRDGSAKVYLVKASGEMVRNIIICRDDRIYASEVSF